jgi:hypothetical protein
VLAVRAQPWPLLVQPDLLEFGAQVVSWGSAVRTISLVNGGSEPLTILGLHVYGPAATDYGVLQMAGGPTLTIEQRCTLTIMFRPTTGGPRWAMLRVWHDKSVAPVNVPLAGDGIWWGWVCPLQTIRLTLRRRGPVERIANRSNQTIQAS